MKLIFFRHGQTEANVLKLCQGNKLDFPLNEEGVSQAKELKKRAKKLKLPVVFCSRLKRAVQTAELLASASDAEVIKVKNLHEMCYGVMEGLKREDIPEEIVAIRRIFNKGVDHPEFLTIKVPGGESRVEIIERWEKALKVIKQKAKGLDKVAIVTHGSFMRVVYYHYFNEIVWFDNCTSFEVEI